MKMLINFTYRFHLTQNLYIGLFSDYLGDVQERKHIW